MDKNPAQTQQIVSNQIALEEVFVQAIHIYQPEHTISTDELDDLRQNIVPILSQAMSELGYKLTK